MKEIKRGQVYYADISGVVGSEQGGYRPVLIIQNNVGNKYSPTVIVVPFTSVRTKAKIPTHTLVKAHGLKIESTALCEQIKTIDKSRLKDYVGDIPIEDINKIDTALKISLGLQ